MTAVLWFSVALLGAGASAARFELARFAQQSGASALGATLVVNIAGSFALGALTGAGVSGDALLLTGTSALGSFTTFSAWMEGSRRLGEQRGGGPLAASVALSLCAGLTAALLGRGLGALIT